METLKTGIKAKWYFIAVIVLLAIPYLALASSIVLNFNHVVRIILYLLQQISSVGAKATFKSWLGLASYMGCDTVIIYISTARLAELILLIGLIFKRQWARVGLLWFIPISLFINYGVVPLTKCHVYKSSMPWGFWGIEAIILAIIAWGLLMHPKIRSQVGKIASNKPFQHDAEKPRG